MENIVVSITHDKAVHRFEVSEYPHHDGERCKYRAYENGEFVASFEPDAQKFLHICQNAGELEEELLFLLADQLEAKIPHAEPKHLNDNPS